MGERALYRLRSRLSIGSRAVSSPGRGAAVEDERHAGLHRVLAPAGETSRAVIPRVRQVTPIGIVASIEPRILGRPEDHRRSGSIVKPPGPTDAGDASVPCRFRAGRLSGDTGGRPLKSHRKRCPTTGADATGGYLLGGGGGGG